MKNESTRLITFEARENIGDLSCSPTLIRCRDEYAPSKSNNIYRIRNLLHWAAAWCSILQAFATVKRFQVYQGTGHGNA